MNRFALGAVAVAAVLGTSGGVALAAIHHPDAPTAGPATTRSSAPPPEQQPSQPASPHRTAPPAPTSTPSGTPTGALEGDPGGPLYAVGNVIHDGAASIRLREDKTISGFTQAAGGYLVATAGPTSAPFRQDLWFVQTDKLQKRIGTVAGAWDLSPDGRSVVGSNPATHLITVWDISSGTIVGQWDRTTDATDQAVFVGDSVYITDARPGNRYALSRWDVGADKTVRLGRDGLAGMIAAASGRYLAGIVGQDGHADPMREDACAAVRSTPLAARHTRWYSCEWGGPAIIGNTARMMGTAPRSPTQPV